MKKIESISSATKWTVDDSRPIGLTGAIAGGKSTVLAHLAEMGLRTASSDEIAREVFHEDFIQQAIAEKLSRSTPVSSSELREAMLADSSLRRWINRLIHPIVGTRVSKMDVDVVEVPLLFEACLQNRYREVWTASCGPEERLRRLRARYGPDADFSALERWQLSERVKCSLADVDIRTDRPRDTVFKVLMDEAARCFSLRIAHPK